MLGKSGSKSRCYSGVQCGIVHTAHDVTISILFAWCLFVFTRQFVLAFVISLLRPAAKTSIRMKLLLAGLAMTETLRGWK